MKKIPTMFERDWNGDRSLVINQPHSDCAWVFAGEGIATRKIDGTCCMVREGKLFKRRELKENQKAPEGFEKADLDLETKKIVGWVPVGDGPEDKYHREAFENYNKYTADLPYDGTYELIGPNIQGNPEKLNYNKLIPHNVLRIESQPPRTFDELKQWLTGLDIEGIVFHHPDGRMAKIKLRDFGLKRPSRVD